MWLGARGGRNFGTRREKISDAIDQGLTTRITASAPAENDSLRSACGLVRPRAWAEIVVFEVVNRMTHAPTAAPRLSKPARSFTDISGYRPCFLCFLPLPRARFGVAGAAVAARYTGGGGVYGGGWYGAGT